MVNGKPSASLYDFRREQTAPAIDGIALAAFDGGAGSIADMSGTGWYTADARSVSGAQTGMGGAIN